MTAFIRHYFLSLSRLAATGLRLLTLRSTSHCVAVEVATKANLNVVIKLGGFHTLVNFLGSLGHLMRGSDFEEVIGEITLTLVQNVPFYCIVDSLLLVHLQGGFYMTCQTAIETHVAQFALLD